MESTQKIGDVKIDSSLTKSAILPSSCAYSRGQEKQSRFFVMLFHDKLKVGASKHTN